jgi:hypothetical protein
MKIKSAADAKVNSSSLAKAIFSAMFRLKKILLAVGTFTLKTRKFLIGTNCQYFPKVPQRGCLTS